MAVRLTLHAPDLIGITTVVAVLEDLISGDLWDESNEQWDDAPTQSDTYIALTEGAGIDLGIFTGAPTPASLGDRPHVLVKYYDTASLAAGPLITEEIGILDGERVQPYQPPGYYADVDLRKNDTADEYTVTFYRDGEPISGVSSATLTVVDRAGTSLVDGASLTQVGSTVYWKHDEASELTDFGPAYAAVVAFTYDGQSHSYTRIIKQR